MTHFYSDTDVSHMYETAEYTLMGLVQRHKILVVDERQPAKAKSIREVARGIVDAILRESAMRTEDDADITTLPGLDIERFDNARQADAS